MDTICAATYTHIIKLSFTGDYPTFCPQTNIECRAKLMLENLTRAGCNLYQGHLLSVNQSNSKKKSVDSEAMNSFKVFANLLIVYSVHIYIVHVVLSTTHSEHSTKFL